MESSGQDEARFKLGEFTTLAVRHHAGIAVSVPAPRFLLSRVKPGILGLEASQVGVAAWVDAGVPHLVIWTPGQSQLELETLGPRLMTHPAFEPGGTNVNLCWGEGPDGSLKLRTWERGVCGETLACGTGAVACAAVWLEHHGLERVSCRVASGHELVVEKGSLEWTLHGPARRTFKGTTQLPAGAGPAGGKV